MKPISDKWIAEVIHYGYAIHPPVDDAAALRKLAKELKRMREAIRRHRWNRYADTQQRVRAFDASLYAETLPECQPKKRRGK